MAKYVPKPPAFLTPQMTGGGMAGQLRAIGEGIISGAAQEYNAATSDRPSRPGGHVFSDEIQTVVQGGALPRVVVYAGCKGPYINAIEFGSSSGAGRGTKGGWQGGRHILGSRI